MIAMKPSEYINETIKDLGITPFELAKKMKVSLSKVSKLLRGKLPITADIAIRLELSLGRSAESWLKMQNLYDLDLVKKAKQTNI